MEVSTEQCTPTALRFEGCTEEDFAEMDKSHEMYFSGERGDSTADASPNDDSAAYCLAYLFLYCILSCLKLRDRRVQEHTGIVTSVTFRKSRMLLNISGVRALLTNVKHVKIMLSIINE
ncbi:hypothetical protein [Lelliottia sp. CFBP8978]|uniref:hypothetical protein n=1 Tax=Lelliottia sp. CFBP8978 TaxID=3096522 RepID=UPI002A6ACF4C|nr:hypothetical protein [Lelliottia sp. CFBP8978]